MFLYCNELLSSCYERTISLFCEDYAYWHTFNDDITLMELLRRHIYLYLYIYPCLQLLLQLIRILKFQHVFIF